MPKIDVCLEAVFENEPVMVERAKKIHEAGYDAIEFWFYDLDVKVGEIDRGISDFGKYCADNGIRINNSVVNSPDSNIGGSLVDPADRDRYLQRLKDTIKVCKDINCHAGITCSGNALDGVSFEEQKKNVADTLKAAAEICEEHNFTLFLEALNTTVDHPGYFVDSSDLGAEIVKAVGSDRVKLLFDCYHMQIMEGNLIAQIEKLVDVIGHFHSAGVPGRHDLDIGELNYPNILAAVDAIGYDGYFGLEYWPAQDEMTSLKKMRELTRV